MQIGIIDVGKKTRRIVPEASEKFIQDLPKTSGHTPEEEKELVARAQRGDVRARNELIVANISFIRYVATNSYIGTIRRRELAKFEDENADCFQIGVIAFMHAIEKFKPEKGTRLISYAGLWINSKVQKNFELKKSSPPLTLAGDLRYGRRKKKLYSGFKRVEMVDDIGPIEEKVDDEFAINLIEKSRLSAIEKFVIKRRLGLGVDAYRNIDLAQYMGIGRNRVSEIFRNSLAKIKTAIKKHLELSGEAT